MKIAYLILCHTDPKHIRRLVSKLTYKTDNECFVHVDKKSNLVDFKEELNNIPRTIILKNRTDISWGSYSAIEATINLMRETVGKGYDRIIILQGLEYPIKSNIEIDNFFVNNRTEYMLAQNISNSTDFKEIHKYRLYWYLGKRNIFIKLLHMMNCLCLKFGKIPKLKKNYAIDKSGNHMQIYQGCAQFGITSELVEYILKFHDNNPKFNHYFKSMYAPDEAYFHTIVHNSDYAKNVKKKDIPLNPHLTDLENLTYFEYPDEVVLFTKKEDYIKLKESGFLYFRKASSASNELLDYIDRIHEKEQEKIL